MPSVTLKTRMTVPDDDDIYENDNDEGGKVPLSEAVANLLPLGLKATAARLVMSTHIKFNI